jgi:hypothetical protein
MGITQVGALSARTTSKTWDIKWIVPETQKTEETKMNDIDPIELNKLKDHE